MRHGHWRGIHSGRRRLDDARRHHVRLRVHHSHRRLLHDWRAKQHGMRLRWVVRILPGSIHHGGLERRRGDDGDVLRRVLLHDYCHVRLLDVRMRLWHRQLGGRHHPWIVRRAIVGHGDSTYAKYGENSERRNLPTQLASQSEVNSPVRSAFTRRYLPSMRFAHEKRVSARYR